jgi:hypothetical protein
VTLTIENPGDPGDHVQWFVTPADDSGNRLCRRTNSPRSMVRVPLAGLIEVPNTASLTGRSARERWCAIDNPPDRLP